MESTILKRIVCATALVSCSTQAIAGTAPSDFRGVSFGSSLDTDGLMLFGEYEDGTNAYIKRLTDNKVAGIEADVVRYHYAVGKFAYGAIRVTGKHDGVVLLKAMKAKYGVPSKAGKDGYHWSWGAVYADFQCKDTTETVVIPPPPDPITGIKSAITGRSRASATTVNRYVCTAKIGDNSMLGTTDTSGF